MGKTDAGTRAHWSRREFLRISGLSAGALAFGTAGFAKGIYPSDDIAYIVPHKAGGGHDIYARAISPYLTKYLREGSPGAKGGDVAVKNEPAAAGRKGRATIFNARPDGYTIGALDTGSVTDAIVEKDASEVDATKFTFLIHAVSTTKMIVAPKNGFNSWSEALEAMKKDPVKMAVGSYGRDNHVCAILVNERLKTRFKLIPLPGTAESMNSLLRGDVQTAICSEDAAKGMLAAKEIKVLLLFDHVSEYPEAVTIKELGHPEMAAQISSHRFVVGPPNLDPEPKALLINAFKKATTDKEFVAWAKKAEFPLKNVYGSDAEKTFVSFTKYFEEMAPILKKNLS